MKPLGRKYYKDKTGGKHKYYENGVDRSWWLNVCTPNKRLEQRLAKKEIETQLDTIRDWLSLEEEQPLCDMDISCEDGLCPVCNYNEYLEWLTDHGHCEQPTWDCPDEDDCPWKSGHFDFKE